MLVFVVFSLHKSYVNKEIATIYKNMCVIVVRAYNKKFENLQFQNRSDKFKLVIYKRGFNSLRFSYMMKVTGLT